MKLKDKVAIITGASSGIGYSTAIEMAKEGCNLVLTYFTNKDEIEKLKYELETNYSIKVLVYKLDLSNEEDINNLVKNSIDEFSCIDILVNNAGIAIDTLVEDKTKDNFLKILDTNLVGVFLLSRLVGNHMFSRKYGKIINVSSTNALESYYPYSLDYDASKAGLISLTHNLALHYKPYVNVNAVAPGWIDTKMNVNLSKEFKDEEISKVYMNRFGNPDEVAKVIVFLASDDSSYINNEVIRVDGGSSHV